MSEESVSFSVIRLITIFNNNTALFHKSDEAYITFWGVWMFGWMVRLLCHLIQNLKLLLF